MIKAAYYGDLARKTGTSGEMLEGDSVSAILKMIKKQHGAAAYKAAKMSHILVNGESVGIHDGYRTKVKDGDEVTFFPVCGGG